MDESLLRKFHKELSAAWRATRDSLDAALKEARA